MNDFDIMLPSESEITVDVTDKNLYNYDFSSFSLAPIQKVVGASLGNKIKESVLENVASAKLFAKLIEGKDTEYVAKLSEIAKEKIKSGEWALGIKKKTGETYGVIRDTVTGKIQHQVNLESKLVNELGDLPELSAIQGQLAAITEKIDDLNKLVSRVEQGQYNDRFAGFFSARQLVIEGLAAQDEQIKRELLLSAIKEINTTIPKLMLSITQDAEMFVDTKVKAKDANRIEALLKSSIGYLNSSVQLNLIAYSALGEQQSLLASLVNYQSFIEQKLLTELNDSGRTLAWKIDNTQKGDSGQIESTSINITGKIDQLVVEIKELQIGVDSSERIETEDM